MFLYVICALLFAALVALDQWVKWWVVTNIAYPGGTTLPFIPHILGLSHTRNTGAAWSILSDHTWILTAVSVLAVLVILYVLVRRKIRHPWGVLSLAVVLAGAAGNLIDRVRLGYVVDMFQTLFMNFPVFNVADICVTCGGAAFVIYFVFFYEKWEKKS